MGDHFTSKDEAIQYYKSQFKFLEDKPDWLVESMIEFCIKYPNYTEYISVEKKIKNKIELTDYERETYGGLDWINKLNSYKKNEIIPDLVNVKKEGEYEDIIKDEKARDKLNKYNLEFGKSLEPSKEVKIKLSYKDGTCILKGDVEELNKGVNNWSIEKE
jgi:hypothetical protein